MNSCQWNKRIGVTAGPAILSLFLLLPNSSNAAQQTGPFGLQGGVVSDVELAAMRGRFVDGRKVAFFGIRMRTDWQRQGGRDFNMEMRVNFDFGRDRYRPHMTMYRSRNIGLSVPSEEVQQSSLDNVSDNGALENISGVVQSIQVAGDRNSVHNAVDWTVTDSEVVPDTEGLIEVDDTGTRSHLSDEGVNTQVSVDAEGVGYQVDIPDFGSVSQQITRSQFSGGNILQSTQLNSDLNQVLNRIGLTVELSSSLSEFRPNGVLRSLNHLRGL